MNSISKKRWQVRLAALAIFALGFVAGGLAFNLYLTRSDSTRVDKDRDSSVYRFERIIDRLHLSPEQTVEVEKVLSDARSELVEVRKQSEPRFDEIRTQTEARLQAALTPEQWQQFQQIKSEMREHGRRRHKRGKHRSKDR